MSQYKSYKRGHTYKHESDIEKGKITKEKTNVLKQRKNQAKILTNIVKNAEFLDDEILESYEDSIHQEKKESGNFKAHKTRLKILIKEDKID